MTAERGYGKTEGLDEEAKAEREIIRAQPLSHLRGKIIYIKETHNMLSVILELSKTPRCYLITD
jgi:hypothetical protein